MYKDEVDVRRGWWAGGMDGVIRAIGNCPGLVASGDSMERRAGVT